MVHWPVPGKHIAAYGVLEAMKAEEKIRSIGVSNYTIEDYEELMSACTSPPVVNQIEINPFLFRSQTISYFQSKGVILQAYRALRNGEAFSHPTILAIAAKHDKTTAQVMGRFCVQNGIIYIPKSVRMERMVENREVFDFALDEQDMAELMGLTTEENKLVFRDLYRKCVVRDTPLAVLDPTNSGVKMKVTLE